jgi:hypothetical protein
VDRAVESQLKRQGTWLSTGRDTRVRQTRPI